MGRGISATKRTQRLTFESVFFFFGGFGKRKKPPACFERLFSFRFLAFLVYPGERPLASGRLPRWADPLANFRLCALLRLVKSAFRLRISSENMPVVFNRPNGLFMDVPFVPSRRAGFLFSTSPFPERLGVVVALSAPSASALSVAVNRPPCGEASRFFGCLSTGPQPASNAFAFSASTVFQTGRQPRTFVLSDAVFVVEDCLPLAGFGVFLPRLRVRATGETPAKPYLVRVFYPGSETGSALFVPSHEACFSTPIFIIMRRTKTSRENLTFFSIFSRRSKASLFLRIFVSRTASS